MDRIDTLRAFAAAARAGSFAGGGRALGLSRDQVSKAIAELEARLGTPLFARSTRSVQLTAAGATYLERIAAVLAGLEEADGAVRGLDATPCGLLKVHTATSFGLAVLAPLTAGFLARWPEMQLEMCLDDRLLKPLPAEVDLVVRVGAAAEPGTASETLGSVRRALYAAPGYLAAHGTPETPEALSGHALLHYAPAAVVPEWPLRRGTEARTVAIAPVFTSTTGLAVAEAVRSGAGIAPLPDFLACRAELVRVLDGWELPPLQVLAMTHPARQHAPKIRAYVEHIRAALSP